MKQKGDVRRLLGGKWWSATQQMKEAKFSTSATQHASRSNFGMAVHMVRSTSRPSAAIASIFHGLVTCHLTCKDGTPVNRFPCWWLGNIAKVTLLKKAFHVNICVLVAWRLNGRCDKPVCQFQNRWPSAWLRRSSCSSPPL